jgi:hypothetical protein
MMGFQYARTIVVVAIVAIGLLGCRERPAADAKPMPVTDQSPARTVIAPPPAVEEHSPPAAKAALIGRTIPPYPQGLAEVQGVCVPGGEAPERICDFGIAVLGRESADLEPAGVYVVASRNADPDARQPSWVVTDALDAPVADAGRELQLGGCRLDGELRSDIVALVHHSEEEYSADIGWARRLDTASGKFVDVALRRVDCQNPGFGV